MLTRCRMTVLGAALLLVTLPGFTAEIAERPFLTVAIARLDRMLDSVDTLLNVAERPELSDILAQRLEAFQDLAGIDRTRPVGMMRTWRLDDPRTAITEQPADVLFVPVSDRQAFLKTITFETVTYRAVSPEVIAIERPGEPYHVLFHDGYAWMGDDVAQLAALARRREQILNGIPAAADVAAVFDFEQIPTADLAGIIEDWLRSAEPLLQRRDGESAAAYEIRRQSSEWFVRGLPEIAAAARQLIITQTMHRKDRRSEWQVSLRIADGNPTARILRSWRAKPTPLVRLDRPEAFTFGVIRGLPINADGDSWELAWQVFGHPFEQRTALVVMAGPGWMETARQALPSGPAEMRLGNGVLRRVTLPATPLWLRRFVGWDPEVWLGDDGRRVWIGFGPPDAVRRRIETAYDLITEDRDAPDDPVSAELRLSARDLVMLAPTFDAGWMDQQLVLGGDQVRMAAEATARGEIVLKATFDVGVLRVFGAALADDLSLDLDQVLNLPAAP